MKTYDAKELIEMGFTPTSFFKTIFYAYIEGAVRECKVVCVTNLVEYTENPYWQHHAAGTTPNVGKRNVFFTIKVAGLEQKWRVSTIYFDIMLTKAVVPAEVSFMALRVWAAKPLMASSRYSGDIIEYHNIENGKHCVSYVYWAGVKIKEEKMDMYFFPAKDKYDLEREYNLAECEILNGYNALDMNKYCRTLADIEAELSRSVVKFED